MYNINYENNMPESNLMGFSVLLVISKFYSVFFFSKNLHIDMAQSSFNIMFDH